MLEILHTYMGIFEAIIFPFGYEKVNNRCCAGIGYG
jgi:hypothetical protein